VSPAPLRITPSGTQVYFGTPQVTFSYSGFQNGESAANLATQPSSSTSATQSSSAGDYLLTTFGASSPNYQIQNLRGTLRVTSAPLSVVANSFSITVKDTLPTLTGNFTGFRGPDSQASTGYGFTDPLVGGPVAAPTRSH
jgi:hypothetical protein